MAETHRRNTNFGQLFKLVRLRSGFATLQELRDELAQQGLETDSSLLSHWQRGARLPQDRYVILLLLKSFTQKGGISSPGEANHFSELADMGYLTTEEMSELFPHFSSYHHPRDIQSLIGYTDNPMTIYFAASARGRGTLGKTYESILRILQKMGHMLVDDTVIGSAEPSFYTGQNEERTEIYWKAIHYATAADLIVLEITIHSFSMGYLTHLALNLGKPVILLYTDKSIPYFASLIRHENLQVLYYEEKSVGQILSQAISFIQAKKHLVAKNSEK